MPRDITIRRATPSDATQIYQVMHQSRGEAFGGILPPAALDWESGVPEGFHEFVQATIAHEEKAMLVAGCDDTIVGFAELIWKPEATEDFVDESDAELKAIHVRPPNWNEGTGTKLLDNAVGILPSDVTGISFCVLVENEQARAFYKRRGFEKTGTTTTTHAGDEFTEAVYRRPL